MKKSNNPPQRGIFQKRYFSRLFYLICCCGATLLLASCIQTSSQLGRSIPDKQQSLLRKSFEQLTARDQHCPSTIIADLTIFSSSPLHAKTIKGYLQFSSPDNYKFAITNPLGQMVWAVAGDSKYYQIVDTTRRVFTSGGVNSLFLRNNLPLFLTHKNWGNWLMARNDSSRLIDIRNDKRGIWFTVETTQSDQTHEHLLIDSEQLFLLQRIIIDQEDKKLAHIYYSHFRKKTVDGIECVQPEKITIKDLDYGNNITLELADLELKKGPKEYTLPKPSSYPHKYLP